jgi:hypothetical protein
MPHGRESGVQIRALPASSCSDGRVVPQAGEFLVGKSGRRNIQSRDYTVF